MWNHGKLTEPTDVHSRGKNVEKDGNADYYSKESKRYLFRRNSTIHRFQEKILK